MNPYTLPAAVMAAALSLLPPSAAADSCFVARDSEGVFSEALKGTLDQGTQEAYVDQINKGNRTIGRCYARAMKREPDLDTTNKRTVFGIRVAADGKVNRVSVLQSDYNDGMLLACLGEMICGFTLPAEGGERSFAAPFNFQMNTGRPEKFEDFRDKRKL